MPDNRQHPLLPLKLREVVHQAINLQRQDTFQAMKAVQKYRTVLLVKVLWSCQAGEMLCAGQGRAQAGKDNRRAGLGRLGRAGQTRD